MNFWPYMIIIWCSFVGLFIILCFGFILSAIRNKSKNKGFTGDLSKSTAVRSSMSISSNPQCGPLDVRLFRSAFYVVRSRLYTLALGTTVIADFSAGDTQRLLPHLSGPNRFRIGPSPLIATLANSESRILATMAWIRQERFSSIWKPTLVPSYQMVDFWDHYCGSLSPERVTCPRIFLMSVLSADRPPPLSAVGSASFLH